LFVQAHCRAHPACRHVSWETELCFLFLSCQQEHLLPCASCLSAPASPLLDRCDANLTTSSPTPITTHPITKTTTLQTTKTTHESTLPSTQPTEPTQPTTTNSQPTSEPGEQVSVVMGGIGYGLVESIEVVSESGVCGGLPPVPSTKYGAAAAFIPLTGEILMCGGYDQYSNLAECHLLSLSDSSWSQFPSLTQPRYRAAIAYIPDTDSLVATGGNDGSQAASSAVEIIRRGDPSWQARPEWSLPKEINGHCSFYAAPHLYIVGGRNNGYELPDTWRLELGRAGAAWEAMAPMGEGKAAYGCTRHGDTFYAVGGGIDNSAFSYSISENSWTRLADLRQARDGPGLGVVAGVLTVFGGRYSGEVDTFEEYSEAGWNVAAGKFFTDARDSFVYVSVPADLVTC